MSNENIPEVTVAPKTNEKCPLDSASMSTSGLSLSPGTMDILSKIPEFHREILLKRWKEDEEAGVLTECFGKGMFDDSDDSKYIFWCGSEDSDGHFFCGGYFDDSNYEFLSSAMIVSICSGVARRIVMGTSFAVVISTIQTTNSSHQTHQRVIIN